MITSNHAIIQCQLTMIIMDIRCTCTKIANNRKIHGIEKCGNSLHVRHVDQTADILENLLIITLSTHMKFTYMKSHHATMFRDNTSQCIRKIKANSIISSNCDLNSHLIQKQYHMMRFMFKNKTHGSQMKNQSKLMNQRKPIQKCLLERTCSLDQLLRQFLVLSKALSHALVLLSTMITVSIKCNKATKACSIKVLAKVFKAELSK